jgi:hypothetical protein
MKKLLLAVCAAAICSAGLTAAKDDVPVTITGCVHEGTSPDTFVFTSVVDVSANPSAPASTVYWLSTTKGLKDHVGHKVQVTGTYSPSRDVGKTAKVKIETDDNGEAKIAVENGMKKAETKELGAVGTSGMKTEIEKPYRRLEVKTIKMIGSSCL